VLPSFCQSIQFSVRSGLQKLMGDSSQLGKQSFRTERVMAVAQTTAPVAEKSHSWPCSMRPRARIVPSVRAICRFANAWMAGNSLNIQQFTEWAAAARHQSHKLPPWLGSTAFVDRAVAQRLQPPVHLPGPFQIGWPGETDVSWIGLGFILHIGNWCPRSIPSPFWPAASLVTL
jgi:hypothetical protein